MEILMKLKLATTVTAAKGRAWHMVSTVSFVIILLLNREQYASGLDLTDFKCENFGSCPEPQNADNLWDCMLKNVLNGDISNAFKKLGHRELINKLTASDVYIYSLGSSTLFTGKSNCILKMKGEMQFTVCTNFSDKIIKYVYCQPQLLHLQESYPLSK